MFIYEKIRPNIINAFMDILNNIEFMFSIDDTLITEQTYNSPLNDFRFNININDYIIKNMK